MQRLARFTDTTISDPVAFGGGAPQGHVRTRVATVAYGYLGVVEEYEDPDSAAVWCLLTLSLPGLAPFLVVDHRSAFGRPGVPAERRLIATRDPEFDEVYAVGADDPLVVEQVLTPPVRTLLLRQPIQRLLLSGGVMMVRTFDGSTADDAVIAGLNATVEGVLSSTPSFVRPRSGRDIGLRGRPLAPGLHGAGDPPEDPAERPRRGFMAGRTRHR